MPFGLGFFELQVTAVNFRLDIQPRPSVALLCPDSALCEILKRKYQDRLNRLNIQFLRFARFQFLQ